MAADRRIETLKVAIEWYIQFGSHIVSNIWAVHVGLLEIYHEIYSHDFVIHKENSVDHVVQELSCVFSIYSAFISCIDHHSQL